MPGCDIRELPLTPLEAYLYALVDGVLSEEDLVACSGLDAIVVTTSLDRLSKFGALRLADPMRAVARGRRRATLPAGTPSEPPLPRRSDVVPRSVDAVVSPVSVPRQRPVAVVADAPAPPSRSPFRSVPTPVPTSLRPPTLRPQFEDQLRKYLDAARLALAEGNALGAANFYRLARELAPNDPTLEAAIEQCAAASALARAATDRAVTLMIFGDNSARARNWREAAEAYQEAAEILPGDARVLYKAAGALYKMGGKRGESADYVKRSLAIDSDRIEAWLLLSQLHLEGGAMLAARAAAQEARTRKPDDPRIAKLLARLGVS